MKQECPQMLIVVALVVTIEVNVAGIRLLLYMASKLRLKVTVQFLSQVKNWKVKKIFSNTPDTPYSLYPYFLL
jgi:hypothetical protein